MIKHILNALFSSPNFPKLDLFRNSLCLIKLALFVQIWVKILRACADTWSKNFGTKMSKRAILANKWNFERGLLVRLSPLLKLSLLSAFISCASCSQDRVKTPPHAVQEINGRDEIISYNQKVRRPVYRAKIPLSWKRIDPEGLDSLLDTTKPIVSFEIADKLRLTLHTFPTTSLEERIPPAAQIERWRNQLKGGSFYIEKITQGGFAGLYFEGKRENTTVCAWSMQLDSQHYQTLHFLASTVEEEEHYKQMAADFTIKVSGPGESIEQHWEEIALFANSFELIQEIPARM